MRIGYFADGVWGTKCLQALVDSGRIPVLLVLRTKPTTSSLEELASSHGIPIESPRNVNTPEFVQRVRSLDVDLNVSMSYNQVLKREIIESTRFGFVNCHAGKLPYYRGRNVLNWALINGESEIGLTVHYVDEGIDTGDIILQRSLPIEWRDTYGTVLSKVEDAFPDLLVSAIDLIESGHAGRTPQRDLPGTYFSNRIDGDEWIDWSRPSLEIYNKIRAISHPGPGARTLVGDRLLTVWRAGYDPEWPQYMGIPGQVVGVVPNSGILVKTGDSSLLIESAQRDGEDEGIPSLPIGTRLGVNVLDTIYRLQRDLAELQEIVARSTSSA